VKHKMKNELLRESSAYVVIHRGSLTQIAHQVPLILYNFFRDKLPKRFYWLRKTHLKI